MGKYVFDFGENKLRNKKLTKARKRSQGYQTSPQRNENKRGNTKRLKRAKKQQTATETRKSSIKKTASKGART